MGSDIFLMVGHSLFVFCFSGLLLGAVGCVLTQAFIDKRELALVLVGAVVHRFMLIAPFLFTVAMAMIGFALYLPVVLVAAGLYVADRRCALCQQCSPTSNGAMVGADGCEPLAIGLCLVAAVALSRSEGNAL